MGAVTVSRYLFFFFSFALKGYFFIRLGNKLMLFFLYTFLPILPVFLKSNKHILYCLINEITTT